MIPKYKPYEIWPKIVPAGKKTTMYIVPEGRAHYFFEGEEYDLTIIPVNGDELDYYSAPITHVKKTLVASNGVLTFDYAFQSEQEHLIILKKETKKLAEFNIYSLEEDLFSLKPLKGDLHSHSFRSDGRTDPSALAGHYREQGYDFQALTDHNRFYPGGEIDEVYNGVNLGYLRINGEEVHTPGSLVHIVHVGGKASVAEIYIHQRERYDREIAEYEQNLKGSVKDQFLKRYAMAKWACDNIHKVGGLAIFAHPYWVPGGSRVYNVNDEFAKILLTSGMFDAYELMGGQTLIGNNRSVALWSELREEGLKISVCGSSDVHSIEDESTYPTLFTLLFAKENTSAEVVDALKNGRSVAVEVNNLASKYEIFRSYGSLRLVSYANYLLKYYFPERQRVCQGEGVAMRAYAIGEADKSLIEAQLNFTKNFEDKFFGRKLPALPTKAQLEFEERWRKTHLEVGPNTCGSSVAPFPITRQL